MQEIRRKKGISIGLLLILMAWMSGTVKAEEILRVPLSGNIILMDENGTREIPADKFSFLVTGDDIEQKVIRADAGGYVDFGMFTLYGEGEYHIHIQQIMENEAGYIYDITPVRVTLQAYRESDGKLSYKIDYWKNEVLTHWIQFVNEYREPEEKELDVWTESSCEMLSPSSEVTHTIHVKNGGQSELRGVYVREYMKEHTLYRSHTGDGGEYGAIGGREHVTWLFESLRAGEERTLSLTFRVNKCFPDSEAESSKVLFEVVEDSGEIYTNEPQDPAYSRTY